MERIAKDTYEGKIKPGQLDPGHVLKTYEELNQGAKGGYGKNWQVNQATGRLSPEVEQMQKNIFRFSGAKNATMLKQINDLLEKDGKQRSWNDFKQDVLKLNGSYNKNYLQAEFQTAKQAGKMAALWADYEDNKTLFPNLKYKTQGDKRVREEHDRLKDIIKPIDDKFWDSFYPPNGWRCRCYVVQTAEDITTDKDMPTINDNDVKPEFKINVGKTGQIFKEGTENGGKPHPYFALVKNDDDYKVAFELLKHNAPKYIIDGVKVSIFADKKDFSTNLKKAKLIKKELKYDVEIRAHLDGRIIKESNPEYLIDNKLADLKSPTSLNYKKVVSKANKQGCEIVVISLELNNDTITKARKQLKNILRFKDIHENIKKVIIITKDNKVNEYNRDEI